MSSSFLLLVFTCCSATGPKVAYGNTLWKNKKNAQKQFEMHVLPRRLQAGPRRPPPRLPPPDDSRGPRFLLREPSLQSVSYEIAFQRGNWPAHPQIPEQGRLGTPASFVMWWICWFIVRMSVGNSFDKMANLLSFRMLRLSHGRFNQGRPKVLELAKLSQFDNQWLSNFLTFTCELSKINYFNNVMIRQLCRTTTWNQQANASW